MALPPAFGKCDMHLTQLPSARPFPERRLSQLQLLPSLAETRTGAFAAAPPATQSHRTAGLPLPTRHRALCPRKTERCLGSCKVG